MRSSCLWQASQKGLECSLGSDLPGQPEGSAAPRFAVFAERDAGTGQRAGGLLQRVQIVKGWIDGSGQARQKVFEIAFRP